MIGRVVAVEKIWLSTKELSVYIGCTVKTIRRLRDAGLIPFYKPFGEKQIYYRKSEIDRIIKKGKIV